MPTIRHKVTKNVRSLPWLEFSRNFEMDDWEIIQIDNPVLLFYRQTKSEPFKRVDGIFDQKAAYNKLDRRPQNFKIQSLSVDELNTLLINNESKNPTPTPTKNPSRVNAKQLVKWFGKLSFEHKILLISIIGGALYGIIDLIIRITELLKK